LGVTFFALTRLNRRQFLGEPAKRKTSCNPKDIAATQVSTVAIFEHCLGEGPELYITAQYAGNGFKCYACQNTIRKRELQDCRLTTRPVLPSPSLNSIGIPGAGFHGSMPALPVSPVNTSATPSRASLHDFWPVIPGRNDSPILFRIELSSTISCQPGWRTKRPGIPHFDSCVCLGMLWHGESGVGRWRTRRSNMLSVLSARGNCQSIYIMAPATL